MNKKNLILIIKIFLIFFLNQSFLIAWDGYDFDNKTSIEIAPGNLVREGNIIQFYETKSDNFRTGKILFMQSVALGTEIELIDLVSKKNRVFIMNN